MTLLEETAFRLQAPKDSIISRGNSHLKEATSAKFEKIRPFVLYRTYGANMVSYDILASLFALYIAPATATDINNF